MKNCSCFVRERHGVQRENNYFYSIVLLLVCSAVVCLSVPLVAQYTPPFMRLYHYYYQNPGAVNLCGALNQSAPITLFFNNRSFRPMTQKPTPAENSSPTFEYNFRNFSQTVTLYPRNNHLGISVSLNLTANQLCRDIPNVYANKILSIDTFGKCVYLYKRRSCEGKYVEIFPGSPSHNRLRDVGLDKKTRSIGVCKNGPHSSSSSSK